MNTDITCQTGSHEVCLGLEFPTSDNVSQSNMILCVSKYYGNYTYKPIFLNPGQSLPFKDDSKYVLDTIIEKKQGREHFH